MCPAGPPSPSRRFATKCRRIRSSAAALFAPFLSNSATTSPAHQKRRDFSASLGELAPLIFSGFTLTLAACSVGPRSNFSRRLNSSPTRIVQPV
jgi:hypothetical protein